MLKLPVTQQTNQLSRNYNSQPTLENMKQAQNLCINLKKLAHHNDEKSSKSSDPKTTDKSTKSSTKSDKTIKSVKSANP